MPWLLIVSYQMEITKQISLAGWPNVCTGAANLHSFPVQNTLISICMLNMEKDEGKQRKASSSSSFLIFTIVLSCARVDKMHLILFPSIDRSIDPRSETIPQERARSEYLVPGTADRPTWKKGKAVIGTCLFCHCRSPDRPTWILLISCLLNLNSLFRKNLNLSNLIPPDLSLRSNIPPDHKACDGGILFISFALKFSAFEIRKPLLLLLLLLSIWMHFLFCSALLTNLVWPQIVSLLHSIQ